MHPSTIFETFLLIDHKHTSQCLSGENGASIELSFGGMRVPISVKRSWRSRTFGITFVMPRVESWYSQKQRSVRAMLALIIGSTTTAKEEILNKQHEGGIKFETQLYTAFFYFHILILF